MTRVQSREVARVFETIGVELFEVLVNEETGEVEHRKIQRRDQMARGDGGEQLHGLIESIAVRPAGSGDPADVIDLSTGRDNGRGEP